MVKWEKYLGLSGQTSIALLGFNPAYLYSPVMDKNLYEVTTSPEPDW
jgi:hypothetical protein